jgi:hypothetical protein
MLRLQPVEGSFKKPMQVLSYVSMFFYWSFPPLETTISHRRHSPYSEATVSLRSPKFRPNSPFQIIFFGGGAEQAMQLYSVN